ncbi:hypothetical protein Tco_1182268 [Tanacetum coccineum]
MIPYPIFTKLIVSHYMTTFPDISRRVHDRYHNLEDDVMIKTIFNSGKSKGVVGMKIPEWMITDAMKLTENYRLYAEVFGVDVPTTQSQPIESIQRTHRTTSAPRTPNPEIAEGESSAPRKSTVIRLLSMAKQKSRKELEATQNVEKVKEHLMAEEIEKLVEGTENVEENVEVASLPLRNDDNQTNPGTRLEPRSNKESPEKGKHVDDIRNTPPPTTTRSPRISTNLVSSDIEKLQELTETDTIPSSSTPSSSSSKLSATNRLLSLFKSTSKFNALARHLQDIMMESLPKMVDERIKKFSRLKFHYMLHKGLYWKEKRVKRRFKSYMSGHNFLAVRPRDQDVPHDDDHTEGNQDQSDDLIFGQFLCPQMDDVLRYEKLASRAFLMWMKCHKNVDVAKKERTFRWVEKCVKRFNPYARYEVEHWKNPHVKIFYIKKQQSHRKPKEEIYLNSKIVKIIKTYWELGHDHKFIIEIVARRANGSIMSITESDYKNLNKNDIEDMYLLIINHKVDDYAKTGLLWSLSIFIRSTMIWE